MTISELKEAIADAKEQFNDQLITQDELDYLIGLAQDKYRRYQELK